MLNVLTMSYIIQFERICFKIQLLLNIFAGK